MTSGTNPDPNNDILCRILGSKIQLQKIMYFLTSPKEKKNYWFLSSKGDLDDNICVENIVNMLNWQAVSKALRSLMFCIN